MEDKQFIRATQKLKLKIKSVLSRRGLTSKRIQIVNVEKSFHSYTELPGKCLSVRLLERRKSSRKKTSNFYLESKIKPFTHSSSYASTRGQPS